MPAGTCTRHTYRKDDHEFSSEDASHHTDRLNPLNG
jgi:hypothetical protein